MLKSLTVFMLSFWALLLFAQSASLNANKDSELLDEYIKSQYKSNCIVFDSSNIKLFWTDNSVLSDKDVIRVALRNSTNTTMESIPLRIQLINVNPAQECKIDVITDTPSCSFSVINDQMKQLSVSSSEGKFINNYISSLTFQLEDSRSFIFYLKMMSDDFDSVSIKKIVLSFKTSNISSFIQSPGKIELSQEWFKSDYDKVETMPDNAMQITGRGIEFFSKKSILINDSTFNIKFNVKNTGEASAMVYSGYALYDKNDNLIKKYCYPYKGNNKIISVVSAKKGSTSIFVDSYPDVWTKNCFIARSPKEDLSDVPNVSLLKQRVSEIKKNENGEAEIILNGELTEDIPAGTKLRIHDPGGGYLYTNTKTLAPGEEAVLESSIKKDESFLDYSAKAFSRGIYYVKPVIIINATGNSGNYKVLISNYSLSF